MEKERGMEAEIKVKYAKELTRFTRCLISRGNGRQLTPLPRVDRIAATLIPGLIGITWASARFVSRQVYYTRGSAFVARYRPDRIEFVRRPEREDRGSRYPAHEPVHTSAA